MRTSAVMETAASGASNRAFKFLQQLADDLSRGDIPFPTFVDAALKVRMAVNDPEIDVDRLAQLIGGEPLLSAKLVRIANSAAVNPSGKPIADVRSAVMRVGFSTVRTTAAAVALEQVRQSKDLKDSRKEAERIWRHSLDVAAISYVLARSLTRLPADEALFAGLVHDVGRFYLLSRAAKYPELLTHRDELERLIDEWHPAIGQSILQGMSVPESVTNAVADHESGLYQYPPKTIAHVVTLANLAANTPTDGKGNFNPDANSALPKDSPVLPLLADAANDVRSLIAALG